MPTTKNLVFTQGSTWRASLDWTLSNGDPKDLDGYTFRMQVRKKYADEDTEGPYVDIDNELKGGIIVVTWNGHVEFKIDGSVISDMPKGGYVYDIEYEVDGDPDKLFVGKVTVNPEVTRD